MKPASLPMRFADGSMSPEQHCISGNAKLKELEEENAKLKKMYANLALDNEILREVIEKKL